MADEGGREIDKQASEGQGPKKVELPQVGAVEDAMSNSLKDKSNPDASLQAILDKISKQVGEDDASRRTNEIMGEHPEVFGGADAAEIAKQNGGKDRQIIIKGVRSVKSVDDNSDTERKVSDRLRELQEKHNAGVNNGDAKKAA